MKPEKIETKIAVGDKVEFLDPVLLSEVSAPVDLFVMIGAVMTVREVHLGRIAIGADGSPFGVMVTEQTFGGWLADGRVRVVKAPVGNQESKEPPRFKAGMRIKFRFDRLVADRAVSAGEQFALREPSGCGPAKFDLVNDKRTVFGVELHALYTRLAEKAIVVLPPEEPEREVASAPRLSSSERVSEPQEVAAAIPELVAGQRVRVDHAVLIARKATATGEEFELAVPPGYGRDHFDLKNAKQTIFNVARLDLERLIRAGSISIVRLAPAGVQSTRVDSVPSLPAPKFADVIAITFLTNVMHTDGGLTVRFTKRSRYELVHWPWSSPTYRIRGMAPAGYVDVMVDEPTIEGWYNRDMVALEKKSARPGVSEPEPSPVAKVPTPVAEMAEDIAKSPWENPGILPLGAKAETADAALEIVKRIHGPTYAELWAQTMEVQARSVARHADFCLAVADYEKAVDAISRGNARALVSKTAANYAAEVRLHSAHSVALNDEHHKAEEMRETLGKQLAELAAKMDKFDFSAMMSKLEEVAKAITGPED